MIIKIAKRTQPFFLASKSIAEDLRLSWKAKGILFYLLSKPDNWELKVKNIRNNGTDGIDSVRRGINELIRYGYIVMQKGDRLPSGKFSGVRYYVYEQPVEDDQPPEPPEPRLEKPDTEKPRLENPEDNKKEETKKDMKKKKNSAIGENRTFVPASITIWTEELLKEFPGIDTTIYPAEYKLLKLMGIKLKYDLVKFKEIIQNIMPVKRPKSLMGLWAATKGMGYGW